MGVINQALDLPYSKAKGPKLVHENPGGRRRSTFQERLYQDYRKSRSTGGTNKKKVLIRIRQNDAEARSFSVVQEVKCDNGRAQSILSSKESQKCNKTS